MERTFAVLALAALVQSPACSSAGRDGGEAGTSRVFSESTRAALDLAEDLSYAHLYDLADARLAGVGEVTTRRVMIDELGMAHTRVQQIAGDVPVFGGEAIIHLDARGHVKGMTDRLLRDVRVDVAPTRGPGEALAAAVAAHGGWSKVTGDPEIDLQIIRHAGVDHLSYRVQISDFASARPSMPVIFVDAHGGEIVWQYDNLRTGRARETFTGNNGTLLPGTLQRGEESTGTGDAPVDDAHDNAGHTYEYYWTHHGRDSFDGAGATIRSTAHYAVSYDNAFWTGSQMVYGDGGTYFYPLSGALDVVAHELTHAVTEYSAGLIYSGESGGLNEATSDIMGAVVESWADGWIVAAETWMVGEDIARPALGTALRYMDDPPADGYSIDHYSDYYSGIDVHYSSGIANKAFYLMVQDIDIDQGAAMQTAAAIWYRALTTYMTSSTDFSGAREATLRAAEDLHGPGSAATAAVAAAWDAVGVYAYSVLDTRTGLAGNTGAELRSSYNSPPGAASIKFAITGGTGDADLYVRAGSAPTTVEYHCRPYLPGNDESCMFTPAAAGTYHVMLRGYSSFSDVTLTVGYRTAE